MPPLTQNSDICPTCHQATLPAYYFCPNCGTKLKAPPLDTTTLAQVKLYLFSIVLPMVGFLLIGRWRGNEYYKSQDPKAKQMGMVSWALLVLSTIFVVWYAVIWTQNYIQATVDGINADMSGF